MKIPLALVMTKPKLITAVLEERAGKYELSLYNKMCTLATTVTFKISADKKDELLENLGLVLLPEPVSPEYILEHPLLDTISKDVQSGTTIKDATNTDDPNTTIKLFKLPDSYYLSITKGNQHMTIAIAEYQVHEVMHKFGITQEQVHTLVET